MAQDPIIQFTNSNHGERRAMFHCPGCGCAHGVPIKEGTKYKVPVWEFNGDVQRPTFSPSIRVRTGGEKPTVCHSFVRNGQIQYLNDCTHHLKGQYVQLDPL